MKFLFHKFHLFFAAGLCMIPPSARAGVTIPEGYPAERYAALWQRSPFTIASVQDAAPQAGFAQNLAVVGIARIGSEDMVILLNKQNQERFTVRAEPNGQGMKVVSVRNDPDPLKVVVTIQKGAEVAKVGFDKALLGVTQSAPPPAQVAAVPNPAPPAVPFPGVNSVPVPGRRVRRPLPVPTPAATNPPQ